MAERLQQVGIVVCSGYRLRVGASSLDAPIDSRLLPGPRPPHCITHPLRAHVRVCTCAHFLWSIGGGEGWGWGWGGGGRETQHLQHLRNSYPKPQARNTKTQHNRGEMATCQQGAASTATRQRLHARGGAGTEGVACRAPTIRQAQCPRRNIQVCRCCLGGLGASERCFESGW